jgi:predicted O-methyltransferase YrrM
LTTSSIPELALAIDQPYDLIFIDADKISYPNYLALILSLSTSTSQVRLLKSGGTIMADNILRRGVVADRSASNPNATPEELSTEKGGRAEQLVALDRFNKELVQNERLETFLLPLFDGLGMGRLKD